MSCVEKTRGDTGRSQLRILLTQHAVGGLSDPAAIERALADPDPAIRAWTIQLATEQGPPAAPILAKFAELARTDPSPVVRLYLASAMQRLPLEKRWDTLAGLVGHGEDASDHNLPLMYWYAAEPLAALDPARAAALAAGSPISADPGIHGAADRRAGNAGIAGAPGRRARPRRRTRPGVSRSWSGSRKPCAAAARWRCPRPGRTSSRSSAPTRRRAFARERSPWASTSATRQLASRCGECSPTPRPTLPSARQALAALLKVKDPSLVGVLHDSGASPAARRPGRPRAVGIRRPGHARHPDQGLSVARPAERRDVLNTLAAARPRAGPCWPRSRPASCRAAT